MVKNSFFFCTIGLSIIKKSFENIYIYLYICIVAVGTVGLFKWLVFQVPADLVPRVTISGMRRDTVNPRIRCFITEMDFKTARSRRQSRVRYATDMPFFIWDNEIPFRSTTTQCIIIHAMNILLHKPVSN